MCSLKLKTTAGQGNPTCLLLCCFQTLPSPAVNSALEVGEGGFCCREDVGVERRSLHRQVNVRPARIAVVDSPGLQGHDRDTEPPRARAQSPAVLTSAPAVPAHLDTDLGTGSSVWRWIHPCTGSALPVLPQIHGEQQGQDVLAAKGGSVGQQNCSPSTDNSTTGLELTPKRP